VGKTFVPPNKLRPVRHASKASRRGYGFPRHTHALLFHDDLLLTDHTTVTDKTDTAQRRSIERVGALGGRKANESRLNQPGSQRAIIPIPVSPRRPLIRSSNTRCLNACFHTYALGTLCCVVEDQSTHFAKFDPHMQLPPSVQSTFDMYITNFQTPFNSSSHQNLSIPTPNSNSSSIN